MHRKAFFMFTLVPFLLVAFVAAEDATFGPPPRGAEAILRLDALPLLREGDAVRHVSSFDRTGGNDDGFAGTWSALSERNGEHVIVEAHGPGCLYTLWFTGPDGGYSALPWGRLRIYFGSEEKPRVDIDGNDFFAGRDPRFPRPLVAGPAASSGGYVSSVPIEFRDGLRITTERRCGFYNALYHTYGDAEGLRDGPPEGATLERLLALFSHEGSWRDARGAAGAPAAATRIEGRHAVGPGKSAVLADIRGEGSITEIRIDPLFPPTADDLRDLRVRISWDDEPEPAVDVPLGMFFGSGLGEAHVTSLLFGMSSSGHYHNAFPMPFWSRARIEVASDASRSLEFLSEVARDDRPYPKDRAGRFRAVHRKEWPTTRGKDYTILDAAGRGSFLGYVLAIHPFEPKNKRWWEGDGRMFADGLRTPVLQGTGHEDEHLGGWSNEFLSRPYSLPFHGEPAVGPLTDVGGQLNGDCSLYRIFVPIPFETAIRHGCEHGIGNRENYRYSSCAFFYLAPATRMTPADSIDIGDPASEAAHGFRADPAGEAFEVRSTFEGDEGAAPIALRGRRLPGPFEFTAHIPPENAGVRLRMLLDQAEGNRAIQVLVDGEHAAAWLRAGANPHRRFREEDLDLPARLTRGKGSVRIRVVPAAGPLAEIRCAVFSFSAR
jgi:hypothetical protein